MFIISIIAGFLVTEIALMIGKDIPFLPIILGLMVALNIYKKNEILVGIMVALLTNILSFSLSSLDGFYDDKQYIRKEIMFCVSNFALAIILGYGYAKSRRPGKKTGSGREF